MYRTEKQMRAEAAYQFEMQSHRLGFSVLARQGNYRYTVRDLSTGRDVVALLLIASFDFYEYRLNRTAQHIDLLIVQIHNAVVPVPVLALKDSKEYDAGDLPSSLHADAKRRNRDESALLVSMLILGTASGKEILSSMPTRTRQWYEQRAREYLKPKRGRPIAS